VSFHTLNDLLQVVMYVTHDDNLEGTCLYNNRNA
jgi:hypothetical protein